MTEGGRERSVPRLGGGGLERERERERDGTSDGTTGYRVR